MICVSGASGRLGSILRATWARADVVWSRRLAGEGWLAWDMMTEPFPASGTDLRGGVMLCLAGVVPEPGVVLASNIQIALAACEAAQSVGARHVFLASSGAVYGPGGLTSVPFAETALPHPTSEYGAAKLAAEREVALWQARHPGIGVTHLRIGNVAGADAVLGRPLDVLRRIDPVPGSAGGPLRSYIGPQGFARVLSGLCDLALSGGNIPPILNIAAPGAVAMGDLLTAAGADWETGPANAAVIPAVVLATGQLERLLPGAAGSGSVDDLVADWRIWRERA